MEKFNIFGKIHKLILVLLFFLKFIKTEIPYYKIIYLYEDKYFIINNTGITGFDIKNGKRYPLFKTFNSPIFQSKEETEMISYGIFKNNSEVGNLLIIKDIVYALKYNESFCEQRLRELEGGYLSQVIPFKCRNPKCFYFVAFAKPNDLNLYLYKNPNTSCSSQTSNTYKIKFGSNNIKCLVMTSSSNGDVLTCFYKEEDSNKIKASSFYVNISNIENPEFGVIPSLEKSQEINGAKIIRASLSRDSTKAFVCFTNDNDDYDCLTYDIKNNEWSNVKTYISGCLPESSAYYLDYYLPSNEYFLYCFESPTKFNLIKFNENFELTYKKLDIECKDNFKGSCTEYNLYSMAYNSSRLKVFAYCDNRIAYFEIPEKYLNDLNIIQEESNKTKEEILENIETDIKNYDIGKIYEIFGEDYNIKISPINTSIYQNISTYINFANCEKILREVNGLSPSDILTVYLIEIFNKNEQSLNNQVEYEVFNEKKEKLDLSVCKNEEIEINYHLNTSKINITKIYYYSNKGINVFNIDDDFFSKICYPYAEGDSDLILNDRVKDIYQNFSICDENCKYDKIDLDKSMATCKCLIKNYVNKMVKPPKLRTILRDSFEYSNLAVIKCYKLVFSFEKKLENIGFCIFTILIVLHFPIFIHYIVNDIYFIKRYIIFEMEKYHYWKELRSPKKKVSIEKVYLKESINKNRNESDDKMFVNPNKEKFGKIFEKNNINDIIIFQNRKNEKELTSKTGIEIISNKNNNLLGKKEKNKTGQIFSRNDNGQYTKELSKDLEQTNKYSFEKYYLIQIDANNSPNNEEPPNSNILLDNYDYETAIIYDKRTFWRLFYICLIMKGNIMNITLYKNPLEVTSLRICLFIFIYSCDLAFNTIFYSNENISEKYHYQGNLVFFSFVNNFIESVVSSIISIILVNIFQHMIESRGSYEDVFRKEEKKMRNDKNYKVSTANKSKIFNKLIKICNKLKCTIIFFIIFEFSLMLFFYYFVTAFCEVYKNTQISWLLDCLNSFLISTALDVSGAFLIAIFYIISIRYKIKFLYIISLFFYNL